MKSVLLLGLLAAVLTAGPHLATGLEEACVGGCPGNKKPREVSSAQAPEPALVETAKAPEAAAPPLEQKASEAVAPLQEVTAENHSAEVQLHGESENESAAKEATPIVDAASSDNGIDSSSDKGGLDGTPDAGLVSAAELSAAAEGSAEEGGGETTDTDPILDIKDEAPPPVEGEPDEEPEETNVDISNTRLLKRLSARHATLEPSTSFLEEGAADLNADSEMEDGEQEGAADEGHEGAVEAHEGDPMKVPDNALEPNSAAVIGAEEAVEEAERSALEAAGTEDGQGLDDEELSEEEDEAAELLKKGVDGASEEVSSDSEVDDALDTENETH